VQDHRLKFNKVWIYIRALKVQEKLKDLVELWRKVNQEATLWIIWEEITKKQVKAILWTIRLWVIQTWSHPDFLTSRLWGTQKPSHLCLLLRRVTFRKYSLSSSDLVQIQTKNFRDKRNERIILVATKEFQMSHQQHYPYQEIFQRSWLKLLEDSNYVLAHYERLYSPCLYKELKTWRKIM
jgi:hypothetical protein